jgi:hypothetical protein
VAISGRAVAARIDAAAQASAGEQAEGGRRAPGAARWYHRSRGARTRQISLPLAWLHTELSTRPARLISP